MRYEHILFDLDGTLTDPAEGITNAIIYGRKKWGLDPGRNEDYYKFIGPPMPQSYETYWGFTPDQARRFLADYREYYRDIGLFENRPYPGMDALLARLTDAGCRLYVATSKPTDMSVCILEKFGLDRYFRLIAGSDPDRPDSTKADVIRSVLRRCAIAPDSAVMVGDRSYDAQGAAQCGLPCVGVLYGYGSREELEQAGAVHVAESVPALGDWLLA